MFRGVREDWALYYRLLKFAKPYWRAVVAAVGSVMVAAAMEPLMPALMKPLVDESLIAKDPTSLWLIPLGLVIVVFLRGVADYAATYSSAYLSGRTIEDLRAQVFAKEMALSLTEHAKESPGRMLTRITYDTEMVADAISSVWMVLIRDCFVIIGLVGFLFYTAWQLAFLVFLTLPLLIVAIRKIGVRLRASSTRLQGCQGDVSGFIQEALMGLREIKLFLANDRQSGLFSVINRRLRKEYLKSVRISALAGPIVATLTAVTVAVVIYFASFITISGGLTPGEFIAFITALAMVFGPIRRLSAVHVTLQRGLAGAESIFKLLDTAGDEQSAARREWTGPPLSGAIKFKNVSFSYPGQSLSALQDCSFEITAGEAVAMIGPSGAGKSTVLNLIASFYVPTAGSILIDDHDIQNIGLDLLRKHISLVGQSVMLFDASIADNVRMGNPAANRAQIEHAVRKAHAWEFISRLPEGLDTPLGSLGGRLSGGQRQRIAIARAFLKDAPILLLDEPTSALDRESEVAVSKGILSLMVGRTVIWVSHSPERLVGIDRTILIS